MLANFEYTTSFLRFFVLYYHNIKVTTHEQTNIQVLFEVFIFRKVTAEYRP